MKKIQATPTGVWYLLGFVSKFSSILFGNLPASGNLPGNDKLERKTVEEKTLNDIIVNIIYSS